MVDSMGIGPAMDANAAEGPRITPPRGQGHVSMEESVFQICLGKDCGHKTHVEEQQ